MGGLITFKVEPIQFCQLSKFISESSGGGWGWLITRSPKSLKIIVSKNLLLTESLKNALSTCSCLKV